MNLVVLYFVIILSHTQTFLAQDQQRGLSAETCLPMSDKRELEKEGTPKATKYYYCSSCPDDAHCSHQSFKKARVWGWTRTTCQDQLRSHLTDRGLHRHLSTADIERHVATATLESGEWPCEDEGPTQKKLATGASNAASSAASSAKQEENMIVVGGRIVRTIDKMIDFLEGAKHNLLAQRDFVVANFRQ